MTHEYRPPAPAESSGTVGSCPECGKMCYRSRKIAKVAARQLYPGQRVQAYKCPFSTNWWHLTSQSAARTTMWKDWTAGKLA